MDYYDGGGLSVARYLFRYLDRVFANGVYGGGFQAPFFFRFLDGGFRYLLYVSVGEYVDSRGTFELYSMEEPYVVLSGMVLRVLYGGQSVR